MMTFPSPIFIGFRAKNVMPPGDFGVAEVCSMSDCVNDPTPGWIERYDWNRASCYNSEELALAAIPDGKRDDYVLFAYRMFPVEFDQAGHKEIDLDERLSRGEALCVEPNLYLYTGIGYDVANGPIHDPQTGNGCGFGCSPLSCNGCSAEFPVNQYHLIDDLDAAIRAAETFGIEEPEPAPFFIYEILRKGVLPMA